MPIDIETFESSPEDRLQHSGETNADRVMRFLAAHPDQAFTQKRNSRRNRRQKRGASASSLSPRRPRTRPAQGATTGRSVRVDDVAAYASMLESTRAANDRFGEEDMDEWLEHAVDDEDEATE